MSRKAEQKAILWTQFKMFTLAVSMFIFCLFVLPPLYTLFCEITGINGKTNGKAYTPVTAEVDRSRTVRIQFVASNGGDMPWAFKPESFSLDVHPGEATTTYFDAHNMTGEIMVGQAVPSLAPRNAIDYFHKTECFCFNSQVLKAGEEAKLGLQFIVDQDLPKNVKTITLSYSLFDVTKTSQEAIDEALNDSKKEENSLTNAASFLPYVENDKNTLALIQ